MAEVIAAPDIIEMRVGLTCKTARLCATGRARIRAVDGALGYKSSDRIEETLLETEHVVARKPYVFCRFISAKTGKMSRPELGRFLLNAERPVRHINGDPLDFRLVNLEPIPEKEKTVAIPAVTEPRPLSEADGKTVEEQIETLGSIYEQLLEKARRIIHDPPKGASGIGVTEGRAGEVVAAEMPKLIERIRAGKIRDVVRVAFHIIEVKATKEKARKKKKFSPIQPDKGQEHLLKQMRKSMPSEKSFFLASSDGGRSMDLCYNPSAYKSPQASYEDFLVSASDE